MLVLSCYPTSNAHSSLFVDVEIFFDATSASVTEGGTVMACSIRLSSCYPSDIPVSITLMTADEGV